MFIACGVWCLADVSSVSPSSEQTPTIVYCSFHEENRVLIGEIQIILTLTLTLTLIQTKIIS